MGASLGFVGGGAWSAWDIVVSESWGEVPRRRSGWEPDGAGRLWGELVEVGNGFVIVGD